LIFSPSGMAGVNNVVATLGTALTREQVELIRRFTRNVAVIFDPDEAGRHAVERSLNCSLKKHACQGGRPSRSI